MNRGVLIETMNELSRVLLLNKEAFSHGLLDELQGVLQQLQEPGMQDLLTTILGDKVASLTTAMEKIIEIEKRLLQPQQEGTPLLSDRLVASLNNLKQRPLVLTAMAAVL